ncbi:MAG: AAA family ATPase [Solirubrobacterales bacterium]
MQARIQKKRNPFSFGGLARDDDFADREQELEGLTADAINGQDAVVLAPRRIGKSSLIGAVMTQLVRNDVLVADIDLWKVPNKEKLAEALAAAIYGGIATMLDRAIERALTPFRGLRITPTISIDPGTGAVSFTFSAESSQADVDATLERLLELPAELAAERGKSAVLVIDEFQEIVRIDRNLTKVMRSVFQRQPEVGHIYLGSKRHLMEQIFNDPNEPFWRSAKQIELGPIPTDMFAEFIEKRFGDTGKAIDGEVVRRVLEKTGGHPYATQRFCYEVWQATDPGETATEAELDLGLEAVLIGEDGYLALTWEDSANAQQLLLGALAKEPGHPLRKGYRARHQLPAATNVQRAVGGLTQRELITKDEDGTIRIAEPFFAEWINRRLRP